MYLSSLSLQHFRSYTKRSFEFSNDITILLGDNARGKTNVLEAIQLLSTGVSFRAHKIEEMVQWNQELGRVSGVVELRGPRNTEKEELEVMVTTGLVQGERVQKRKFLINGVSRRRKELLGILLAVIFRPEDLDIVSGSPSMRRHFLDNLLSQADQDYRRSLETYEKALKRRNALLDVLREGQTTRAAFAFWDQLLIKHGNVLTDARRKFCDYLNDAESQQDFPMKFSVEYDHSTISEKRLHQYAVEEVAAGYTLVGPHKDDIHVRLNDRDLAAYGSRGEQRMGVLWLKWNEMDYVERERSERPILLLDDIFSELDEKHQHMVVELAHKQQTIFTTTDLRGLDTLKKKTVIEI